MRTGAPHVLLEFGSTPMTAFRQEIENFQQNGITRIAFARLHDDCCTPLWFGEGDEVTPDFIREAAKASLDQGHTFYTHTRGRVTLRGALRHYLQRIYGRDVHPDRITVPGSAMLGVNISAQMAVSRGDHVLVVSPVWPNIGAVFRAIGAEIEYLRQHTVTGGWHISTDEIIAAVRPNTRAIFINSPCNPTGWVMSRTEQLRLLEFCREREVLIIADEVYHRCTFETPVAPSFVEIAEDEDPVIVVNSFSKAWAMTGWRIGWVVAPKRLAVQWAALSECFNTGANVFAQAGARAALEQGEAFVAEQQAKFAKGRELVSQAFKDHPKLEYIEPEGAFYAFPKVRGLTDSFSFAEALRDEMHVGVAPGFTFGPGNESHFRICFARGHEELAQGLDRILAFLAQSSHKFAA